MGSRPPDNRALATKCQTLRAPGPSTLSPTAPLNGRLGLGGSGSAQEVRQRQEMRLATVASVALLLHSSSTCGPTGQSP